MNADHNADHNAGGSPGRSAQIIGRGRLDPAATRRGGPPRYFFLLFLSFFFLSFLDFFAMTSPSPRTLSGPPQNAIALRSPQPTGRADARSTRCHQTFPVPLNSSHGSQRSPHGHQDPRDRGCTAPPDATPVEIPATGYWLSMVALHTKPLPGTVPLHATDEALAAVGLVVTHGPYRVNRCSVG